MAGSACGSLSGAIALCARLAGARDLSVLVSGRREVKALFDAVDACTEGGQQLLDEPWSAAVLLLDLLEGQQLLQHLSAAVKQQLWLTTRQLQAAASAQAAQPSQQQQQQQQQQEQQEQLTQALDTAAVLMSTLSMLPVPWMLCGDWVSDEMFEQLLAAGGAVALACGHVGTGMAVACEVTTPAGSCKTH
jgi:hypothetical protein